MVGWSGAVSVRSSGVPLTVSTTTPRAFAAEVNSADGAVASTQLIGD
jgi:hypothetical protein